MTNKQLFALCMTIYTLGVMVSPTGSVITANVTSNFAGWLARMLELDNPAYPEATKG